MPTSNVKVGNRIRLIAMPDDPNPIPVGTEGTVTKVTHIEFMGFTQVAVKWDNGSGLMLSMPPDVIQVLPSRQET